MSLRIEVWEILEPRRSHERSRADGDDLPSNPNDLIEMLLGWGIGAVGVGGA